MSGVNVVTIDSAAQISKRHHFVPEFYLSRWCDKDGYVQVVRKVNGSIKWKRHTPKHTGFDYNLYAYHEDFQTFDRSEVETQFFKPLDNEGAKIIDKMISEQPLERREFVLWTQFLTSMRMRTPDNVAKLQTTWERGIAAEMADVQTEFEELKKEGDSDTPLEWLSVNRPGYVESLAIGQLPQIASDPTARQAIASFIWMTVNFDASTKPLLTSDRPCVWTFGLDDPHCIIALPLSPRHAFFAFPSDGVRQKIMERPTSSLAADLNDSVVRQANSRAYCQTRHDAPDTFFQTRLSSS